VYQISVEQHFDAAHYLRGYQGKCEALHGHRYKVVLKVEAAGLNDIGLAYDFVELKEYLAEVIGRFDHICLNDVPPFTDINPSAENLATNIFNELKARLAEEPVTISSVEVWESPQTGIIYAPD
jgi:6-pyruvoyltetrahydropterin/6-carboxytetrahydropterin synthase